MAKVALNVSIGQALSGIGSYNTSFLGGAQQSLTALNASITTALAAANATHDSTPEINAIQTQVNALVPVSAGDVTVYYDTVTITSLNQLKAALDHAFRAAKHNGLT